MKTMKKTFPMFQGFARCLMVAGLSSAALLACSSDDPITPGGTAGTGGTGTAGTATGGSAPSAGTSNNAGTSSAGMSSAGTNTGGNGGTGTAGTNTGGSGGSAGTSTGGSGGSAGTSTGGSGGSSGGTGGSSGGSGGSGGSGTATAVANLTGLKGVGVTGTATFTQGATMTTLVLNFTACPAGPHASHIHAMKDCGSDGDAAGGHWMPNGENLGDFTCADNKGMHTVMKPTSTWTVGDGSATDVTKYAFIVHEMGGTSSVRIGCGLINKQ